MGQENLTPGSTPRRARRAIISLLLSVLALNLAAPASADAASPQLGLVTGGVVSEGDIERIEDAGVSSVRLILNWRVIETRRRSGRACSTAEYGGFERYDRMVSAASRHGFRLLPFFLGSPRYAAPSDSSMPRTGTRAIHDYRCFVKAVVDRYGRGGSYFELTNLNGDPRARPITTWQVWNEQNLVNYAAGGKPSAREYGRFLKLTSAQIRRVDPRATVVLGGMPEFGPRGTEIGPFLRQLYRVDGVRRAFDVLAFHPYAGNARTAMNSLIRLRRLLGKLGDRRRPLWLTEVGYATGGRKGQRLVKTEPGQARHLRRTFQMIRENHKRFGIGAVHWFRWRDREAYAEGSLEWPNYAGLYRKNGTPKPSCNAFVAFTGGRRPCRRIEGDSGGLIPLPELPLLPR